MMYSQVLCENGYISTGLNNMLCLPVLVESLSSKTLKFPN